MDTFSWVNNVHISLTGTCWIVFLLAPFLSTIITCHVAKLKFLVNHVLSCLGSWWSIAASFCSCKQFHRHKSFAPASHSGVELRETGRQSVHVGFYLWFVHATSWEHDIQGLLENFLHAQNTCWTDAYLLFSIFLEYDDKICLCLVKFHFRFFVFTNIYGIQNKNRFGLAGWTNA